jgi:hypothetical protein
MILSHVEQGWQAVDIVPGGPVRPPMRRALINSREARRLDRKTATAAALMAAPIGIGHPFAGPAVGGRSAVFR